MEAEQSVSKTAQLIARAMIFRAGDPEFSSLITPAARELSEAFLEESAGPLTVRMTKSAALKPVFQCLETLIKPGITVHYVLRKEHIEKEITERLTTGSVGQVVILGAGFDTLALRIHRTFPAITFFEIDRPAILQAKERASQRIASIGSNFHLLPVRARGEPFHRVLERSPHYSNSAPTVYVAEGLLMYLTSKEVDQLFASIAGSRDVTFIFTFLDPLGPYDDSERPLAERLGGLWLRTSGESYRWSISTDQLPKFCAERGIEVLSISGPQEWMKRYQRSITRTLTIPRDELVAVTRVANS